MKLGKINKKEISDISIKGIKRNYIDSSVKLALLTVVAGYLESDNILVHGKEFLNTNFLNNFLSYILNDKRAAPRKFSLNINFDGYGKVKQTGASNNYDLFLSYSGGADSTAGLLYALDCGLKVKPIYVAFGQKNEKQEIITIKKILGKLKIEPLIVKIDIDKYIDHEWKRWKLGIIPARNYLFAAIAGSVLAKSRSKNPQIWVCAHKEEINPIHTDKSDRFFRSCSKILSDNYGKNISVTTPFKDLTKPEIVSYWHKHWEKKYNISVNETVSCYFGNSCGVCKACINRAVVFLCAGIKIENFKINPFLDRKGLIQGSYINKFNSLDIERKLDFLYALWLQKDILAPKLREFIERNYPKYKNMIYKRIFKLRRIEKL